jgi:adenylyltransferase/sulfurtransferase
MVDVVIGCLDSRIARYQLNRLCMRAGKTWVDGSIENMTGVVKVYTPGIACYECGLSREEFNNIMLRTGCADVVRLQSSAGRVATTPISASIIGAMQVQEAMKIIHLDTEAASQFHTLQGKMFHYEGMTNSTKVFKFASWKNNCMAHERWENIITGTNLSATQSVKEILVSLKSLLNVDTVEINMCNNKFIDKIVSDKPEKEFNIMIPESQLDQFINNNVELRKLSHRTLFHKSFYENIDADFPYQDLTLQQIGIPLFDVLQISTEKGMFHVELSADSVAFQ